MTTELILPEDEIDIEEVYGANAVFADDYIPPGYKLTYAARLRMQALADAPNRLARRFLLAKFAKAPVETFEKLPTP